jgi:hypothetical protein
LERASGTIKRNSRKPRARLRSRMAFIRSAASTTGETPSVTRYSVTRYHGPRKGGLSSDLPATLRAKVRAQASCPPGANSRVRSPGPARRPVESTSYQLVRVLSRAPVSL